MPSINLVITNAGRALLPANGGVAAVQLTQVGLTSTAVVPGPALVALAGEFKRINTVSGATTSPDTVSLAVIDESNDTYDLRAIGLYTSTGVLFAVAGQAEPIVEKASQSNFALALDVKFADIDAAEVVFGDANFLLPAATTERQGLIELATDAEVAAKLDSTRAVTAKSLWFAFSAWVAAAFSDVWRASNDGAGSGLDADLWRGLQPTAFVRGDVTANPARGQGVILASNAADLGIAGAPLQIREINYAGAQTGALNQGPSIAFHWQGQYAASIRMAANGHFHFVDGVGSYRDLIAYNLQALGGAATVWHSGNDGAGSGVDAGLFAGQLPSWYINIPARQGYTSLNKAGDTITGTLYFNDPNFLVAVSSGIPFIVLDDTDSISYDRAENNFNVNIGHVIRLQVNNSGMSWSGNTVWHAGNDGAGSGMDAGLFAGQLPSWYTNINYHLGYTAANKAGETFTGDVTAPNLIAPATVKAGGSEFGSGYVRLQAAAGAANTGFLEFFRSNNVRAGYIGCADDNAIYLNGEGGHYFAFNLTPMVNGNQIWHAGNDGAGSGVDAGLFAGQLPSFYTNVTYHLGYTPLNQASYTAADVLAKILTVDGSGSGIDSDFFRGHAPSDFVMAGSASRWGNSAAGGRRSSDGDVTQWKQGSWDSGGQEASPQTIYYPVPFDIDCDDVQVTTLLSSNNSVTDSFYQLISFDYEKCVVVKQRTTGNDSVSIAPRIRAVGR